MPVQFKEETLSARKKQEKLRLETNLNQQTAILENIIPKNQNHCNKHIQELEKWNTKYETINDTLVRPRERWYKLGESRQNTFAT